MILRVLDKRDKTITVLRAQDKRDNHKMFLSLQILKRDTKVELLRALDKKNKLIKVLVLHCTRFTC